MRYVAAFFLSFVFSQGLLAQLKINYTISNGVHFQGVDQSNPVIYDNDMVVDSPELWYLWLKANRKEVNLVGNISTLDAHAQGYPHDVTYKEFTDAYAAFKAIGGQNVPAPVKGSSRTMTTGQTSWENTTGSDLIISEAKKASPSKPLVIFAGGQVTSIANAYLKDKSIKDNIIVFHVDGYGDSDYNGIDSWACLVLIDNGIKYVNWDGDLNSWYNKAGSPGFSGSNKMPGITLNGMPSNQFSNMLRSNWFNQAYNIWGDIGDAPPILYFFNHSLWQDVQRKDRQNQNTTVDNFAFLLVKKNDWNAYGPQLNAMLVDPNSYIPVTQPSNQSPSISITAPANNANFTIGTAITISANASDADGSVARVEFFYGSTKIGEDLSSPYSIVWNQVTPGTYSITAKATDNVNATTTSSAVSVTLNGNAAPTVSITSPANNATFTSGSNIAMSANAGDTDGTVSKVEFYYGGTKIGEDVTSPYSFTWTSPAVGDYVLTAKAFDNLGAVRTSTAINVSVKAPNVAPTVLLTSPAPNATYPSGSTVTITANASDNDGSVSKVEFFNGTTKIGEDATAPYSLAWTGVTAGTHTISAKVTDNVGATANSSSVSFSIQPANKPPTISISGPANNATFNSGSNITITAVASDSDGTVSKVEFFNGGTKLGEDTSSPYSFTWNSVPAGVYSISTKATDNVGAVVTSAAISITVAVPNTPPVVSITAPTNNSSFNANSAITITANASDPNGTVTKVEFFNGGTKLGEDISSPYSFAWNSVPAGVYSISAKATDNVGAVVTSAAISITVTAPNTQPLVSITAPTNNSSFNANSAITITANASDTNGNVTKVEFFNGGTKLGEDTSSPYSFTWNSVPAGVYSISAKATDNVGAVVTSAAISITVTALNTPPLVNITAPTNNASFNTNSSITITANASDANGTITKVEFFNGAAKLGEDTTAPYSFVWNNVSNGNYIIIAKATDNHNAVTSSSSINIVVKPNPVAPVVKITGPANGSTIVTGTTITLSATASTPTGSILKTEFFNGTTKLGEDATAPYSFNWSNAAAGNYTINVKATSNQGLSGSDQITFTIAGQNLPGNNPPIADAGADITQEFPGKTLTITGTGTDNDGQVTTYAWTQVSGPTEISLTPDNTGALYLDNLVAGTYVFELTVTDDDNATSKDQVTVIILEDSEVPATVNIPRYFTPNNDGINDFWEWPNIELYANSTLIIFNRFGQKIYESKSYQNNWNGTVDGKPLQEDAYYYNIRFSDTDIKGAVRIVR